MDVSHPMHASNGLNRSLELCGGRFVGYLTLWYLTLWHLNMQMLAMTCSQHFQHSMFWSPGRLISSEATLWSVSFSSAKIGSVSFSVSTSSLVHRISTRWFCFSQTEILSTLFAIPDLYPIFSLLLESSIIDFSDFLIFWKFETWIPCRRDFE